MLRAFLQRVTATFPVLVILAIAILSTSQASAQVTGATLSGTVTDPSGAAIANAQVSILNKATGVNRDVTTDSAGLYSAPNLVPGQYDVTVKASGFSATKQSDITLNVGAQQTLNVALRIGEATQTIEVAGVAPLIQLGTSTVSGEVQGSAIRELPLNGRDWASLATLTPGVNAIETQMAYTAGAVRGNRGFGSQLTISGGRPTQNNYRLDGLSINDYGNGGPGSVLGVSLGVDAIEEFSVVTANYSAEYGRTSGGVVNAVSKSGTNAFHGDAYEFLRNQVLDGTDFFVNAGGLKKPPYRRNQFGGAVGGPIKKDRTFFFFDYEGIRQSQGVAVTSTVLSPNARQGILADGTHVNIDPKAAKYINLFPLPNGLITGDKGIFTFAGNYVVSENYYTGRVDHKISDKDSLFGTYMYDKAPFHQPSALDTVNILSQTGRQVAALEETHVFSPALVNSARLGYNRNAVINYLGVSAIFPIYADPSLGMVPGAFNPDVRLTGGFTPTGPGLGGGGTFFNWNSIQFYDDAFWTHGTHSFKFGYGMERMRYNYIQNYQPYGILRFTGSSVKNFLTNNPASLEAGVPGTVIPRGLRQTLFAGYIQDDWKFRHNLTLNLGLRYEMATVINEVQGMTSSLATFTSTQPTCGTLNPARTTVFGQPGCAGKGPFYSNPTLWNFEPRIGFAWDPKGDGKMAIRGGFALFDVLPLPGYFFTQDSIETPFFLDGLAKNIPGTMGLAPTAPGSAFSKFSGGTVTQSFLQQNPKRNYIEQWNVNFQRQITQSLTATVGYIGSHGVHMLMRGDDGNMVIPTHTSAGWLWPSNPTGADLRINPNVGAIRFMTFGTTASYEALQFNIQKRLTHGLQFGGSYTYSKAMDDSSATIAGDAFSNSITSWFWFAPQISHAPSDFDVRHSASVNAIWQVPVPQSWNGFGKAVLGNWEMGSILKLNSGIPTTPLIGGDPLGVQNNGSDLFSIPDRVPGCNATNSNFKSNPGGVFLGYLNPNCYTLPKATPAIASQCVPFIGNGTAANPQYPGTCSNLLGNAGRNSVYGPGLFNLDFSLYKNIPIRQISETFNVQFRAEFFNILNHPNFGPPLDFQGSQQAQLFGQTGAPTGAGGLQNTVTLPRDIQFALKVIF
jgi:hypothetical protein